MAKLIPINLNLEYTKKEMRDGEGTLISPVMMSRILISTSVEKAYTEMDRATSILYRGIAIEMEDMIDEGKNYLIVGKAEFELIKDVINKAKLPPSLGIMVPVLYQELDRCSGRSDEENEAIVERITHASTDE